MKLPATVRIHADPISQATTYRANCVSPYGRISSRTFVTSRDDALADLVRFYHQHMAIELARRAVTTIEETEIEV